MTPAYAYRTDWRGLGLVVLAHIALAFVLFEGTHRSPAEQPRTLMVSVLPDTGPEPLKEIPKPPPPKPKKQPTQPVQMPLPVLAAPVDAPTPGVAPEPVPVPAVAPAPLPEPAKPVTAPAITSPLAPVVPPRFDAAYLDNPAPAYPALSRRLGEQGRVLLRVFVEADGSASRVEVRESSSFERLDKVARDTVRHWRFMPARQGEAAVAAWVLVPVSFSLRS